MNRNTRVDKTNNVGRWRAPWWRKTQEKRPSWVYWKGLCCTTKRKTKKLKSYLAFLCHFLWIRAPPSQLLHPRLLFWSPSPTLIPVISETHRCLWEERLTTFSMDEHCQRFVLMCKENQGVSTSHGERVPLLHPIIGKKLNTQSRGRSLLRGDEWRWTHFEHAHMWGYEKVDIIENGERCGGRSQDRVEFNERVQLPLRSHLS